MSLIKYNQQAWPRDVFGNMLNQFLRGYEDESNVESSLWSPSVDIQELDDKFLVHADIPGVDGKDIEVSLEHGQLTIKGERQSETKEEKRGFTRLERFQGQFYRRFTLPETANEEGIQASYKKGVLEIAIPKKEVSIAKRIDVLSEE